MFSSISSGAGWFWPFFERDMSSFRHDFQASNCDSVPRRDGCLSRNLPRAHLNKHRQQSQCLDETFGGLNQARSRGTLRAQSTDQTPPNIGHHLQRARSRCNENSEVRKIAAPETSWGYPVRAMVMARFSVPLQKTFGG